MPALIAATLLALVLWLHGQHLDSIEQRRINVDFVRQATLEHVRMTVVSTVLVLVIAIPTGILLTRGFARRIAPLIVALFNIGQATPSIGVVVLLALIWDIGFWPMIAALVAYSALVVLRNTMVGLQQVDEFVIESARGMGMGRLGVLTRIELPLAVPVMLAGVRTALVLNVGTATLGVFINAGGLGAIITTGIVQGRPLMTFTGSVLVACLALTIDYLAGVSEDLLRPRGL